MLRKKVSMITGANRGIGLATVELFAENGAYVWACAREKSNEFEEKMCELAEKNATTIETIYFDIRDLEAVKNAVKIIGKNSEIDILVNNAGVSVTSLFQMTSLEVIRQTMEVNFLSQIKLSQLVSRYMMKAKKGSIVNVASVSGVEGEAGGMAYGSSKAALIYSTRTMANEMGRYGIRVNAVSPGFIETDMWGNRREEMKELRLEETPLGRLGTPREVANVILFLASDMSSYITGQNIIIDGGRQGGHFHAAE